MTIGEKISKLRKNKHLTQEELGNEMSVSRQAIQKWESGVSLPDVYKLKQLADFFNVTVDYFLNEDEVDKTLESINNTIQKEPPIENDTISEYIQTITDVFSTINGLDFIEIKYSNSCDEVIKYDFGNDKNSLLDTLIIDSKYLLTKGITYQFIFKLIKHVLFRNIYKVSFNENQNVLLEHFKDIDSYSSYLSQKIMHLLFNFGTFSPDDRDVDFIIFNNIYEENELYFTRLIEDVDKVIKSYNIDICEDQQLKCVIDVDSMIKSYKELDSKTTIENDTLEYTEDEPSINLSKSLTTQKSDRGILPKVFFIISCAFSIYVGLSYAYMGAFSYYAFSLFWKIPMTIYVFYAYNKDIEISNIFKIISFLLISPFAGIALFKSGKRRNR